jgi:hypothetical protein
MALNLLLLARISTDASKYIYVTFGTRGNGGCISRALTINLNFLLEEGKDRIKWSYNLNKNGEYVLITSNGKFL